MTRDTTSLKKTEVHNREKQRPGPKTSLTKVGKGGLKVTKNAQRDFPPVGGDRGNDTLNFTGPKRGKNGGKDDMKRKLDGKKKNHVDRDRREKDNCYFW